MNKQVFTDGQVLNAEHLNNIENKILINSNKLNSQCIHMSFDDVTSTINALASGSLNSAWDNSFLAMLKEMHEKYGFVFSLYLQTKPSSVSTKYQKELGGETANWLKWGLHSFNNGNYQNSSYEQGLADWESMVDVVFKLTGSLEAIDRMPRLHQFYGSENAITGMRDAKLGALGFLSADDARTSYHFSEENVTFLYEKNGMENDHISDYTNGLVFYRTDLRLDWFNGAGFNLVVAGTPHHTPSNTSDITAELERRYSNKMFMNTWNCFVVFTHETQSHTAIKNALIKLGEFANSKNIPFDYPQNRVTHICSGDIK